MKHSKKELYEMIHRKTNIILELLNRLDSPPDFNHNYSNQELQEFLQEVDLSFAKHYRGKIQDKLAEEEGILNNLVNKLKNA